MAQVRLVVLSVVAAVLVLGCGSTALPGPDFEGRTFLSVKVSVGGADRPLVPGTRIRLSFGNGSLGASVGCNSMSGTYTLDGDRLRVEDGAMTEMGCDPERHAQDVWLFGFLGSGPTIQPNGNDLLLASGDTIVQLVDRGIAEPDRPLVGTVWVVDTIISGQTASSTPAGVVATFRFTAAGRLELDTGCNSGGGDVSVEGSSLRFEPVVLTERACAEAQGQMERAILAVLASGGVDFSIEADGMTLQAGDVGLGLRAAPGS